ncbi:VWA domain-containing protein [Kibdelosporangium persicum]|uniref:von Willebrand factor type A n=1 Tax=Kibdelosporangium persicum TaxID=2698649 RepID=A0ABX2FGU0_9PSEU|nr:VWA domain-containing protein [Kibdelosporangium persicum]NRN69960.1 von Willebrand factor type A [Kibdelosporangium persicum]
MTDFQIEVYQNEYLPQGAAEVNAIVTVTASGSAAPVASSGAAAAEVIIIDTSGSMHHPPTKLAAAKAATNAAIDALRDGVNFAVVSGSERADLVYPPRLGMRPATALSREEAKRAVNALRADGGTAMGEWLLLARELFATQRNPLRHAILLTDGQNVHERPKKLERILEDVAGQFVCDCRGVGTDWEVKELRKIATALLGTVDIVADPSGLADDFRAMTSNAMGKEVADVSLRLWTPQGATVKFVKQVEPTLTDLTSRRVESAPRSGDYPTGAWGSESRDYHVCIQVQPAAIGDKMLAGRVSLVSPSGDVLGKGQILAVWTDDTALSTKINPEVAHYTGQAELATVIEEGLEAQRAGQIETATAKLGRAVKLAHESGHEDTAKLLAKVVDVVDPADGTIRLKRDVATVDAMTLESRSSVTKRVGRKSGEN